MQTFSISNGLCTYSVNGCKTSACKCSITLNLWHRFVKSLFQIVQLLFSIPFTVKEGKIFEFSDRKKTQLQHLEVSKLAVCMLSCYMVQF